MNALTPIPPRDPGFQLLEPMPASPPPSGAKFRPQKLLFFLRKFWWIPLITLTLAMGGAVTKFFLTPPIFVSYGSLWQTQRLKLPDGASFTEDHDDFLGTQSELLQSEKLRQLTLSRMRALDTNSIINGADGEPLPVNIQVFASPKSSVYTIQAKSANPAYTPAYLNALMSQYLEYRRNVRQQVSSGTLASIAEQVQRLERDMKTSQAALNEYEQSNNFAVLQEESQIEASYLSKLKTQLSDYELQMKLLDARELENEANGAAGPLSTNVSAALFDSLSGSSGPSISLSGPMDANKQIELLKLKRDRLAKNLRPKHPKIIKLDEEIAQAEKLVDFYHTQNRDQIEAARKALQIKVDSVKQFVTEWEAKVESSNRRIAEADRLKQNVQRNQSLYDHLSSLLQTVDIGRNIDQETLAILEPASPSKRSYSEAKRSVVQSVILGLGLGLGIVFLIAWRDDRFSSMVEVTERFGDNVVGQVPDMPRLGGNGHLQLLHDNDERHIFAESYRNLRSALLYLTVDGERPRVLLVTSAVPNEGKSTVATNLARALALGGSKVVLVDADMRRGHIHELLKAKPRPGLNEVLLHPDSLLSAIQNTDLPNFHFLSRGGTARHPGDLFLSAAFDHIVAELRQRYDYVLIDCSPVFAADDSATLAPKVDGTLFVVRSRFSQARMVKEALELLFQRQAKVLGLVLNRSDASAKSYYSYKYAEYYAEVKPVDGE